MTTQSAEEVSVSIEKLLQDLRMVIHDGEALLRAGARDLGARGAAARDRLADALEVAKRTQRRLQQRAVEGARSADRFVRANPYPTLGIAFGIGLLFGTMARRR